jgi:hypothetical protein
MVPVNKLQLHSSRVNRVCKEWDILVDLVIFQVLCRWQEEGPDNNNITTLRWLADLPVAMYTQECRHRLCTKETCLNTIKCAFLMYFQDSLTCREDTQDDQWKEERTDGGIRVEGMLAEEGEEVDQVVAGVVRDEEEESTIITTAIRTAIKITLKIQRVQIKNRTTMLVSKNKN